MLENEYIEIKHERFIVDMMYARANNMLGQAIYQEIGWGNKAVVHKDLWQKLENLVPELVKNKMKMKICDAYRPKIAHEMMKKLIPMKGFFADNAERSQHCLGTAVDVCLCDEYGQELSYPTKVDAYDAVLSKQVLSGNIGAFTEHLKKARHDYFAEGLKKEIENREFLKNLMESVGLESIQHEWWHYNLPNGKIDNYPIVDLRGKF
ncbi:MAG: hypothetical protein J6W96_06650 [Alphaproteobacteria bacterium]|nr:hypothetical protein [Alphaproteobacteria bacterium]